MTASDFRSSHNSFFKKSTNNYMKTKVLLLSAMLSMLTVSCARETLVPQDDTQMSETEISNAPSEEAYLPGEAYVYFSEDMAAMIENELAAGSVRTKSAELNQAMDAMNITEIRRLFPHAGEYEPRTRKEGLHRWYVVRYTESVPHTKAEDNFMDVPGVEFVEPVAKIKINDYNDLNSKLWGLNNTSLPGVDINVIPVWNNYTSGSPDVIVSVVDQGVDILHEDLSSNTLPSGRHYSSVAQNNTIVAGSHGTHVAGTIAAVGNNGKGIAGIAGGDYAKGKAGVKIMSCEIFREKSDGTVQSGSSAAAIKWAADNGAVISQNSWGYSYDTNGDGKLSSDEVEKAMKSQVSSADRQAIDYFIKYAGCDNYGNQLPNSPMKGGVVIFASGNDAIQNCAPANYSEVIAVGSIASNGTRSTFSNYGDWVDIAAPGTGIYSTIPDNRYADMSGTSMACPHVSGVAALLVSYFGGPGFTNEMLKERLLSSTNTTVLSPAYRIGGLVDAYGAFVYGKQVDVEPVRDLTVSGRGNNIDLTWTVPADSDGDAAYGFLILYGTDKDALVRAHAGDYTGVQYQAFTPGKQIGEEVTYSVSKLEFTSTYYVKVIAYSYSRSYSEPTDIFEAATTENNAPVITTSYEGDLNILPSETIRIPLEIVEPDDHSFTCTHIKGSDAETFENTPDGKWRLTIKGTDAEMGTYTATIIAEDEFGLSGELRLVYTIKENTAPVKLKEIENVLLTAKGKEFVINMSEYVTDEDGEQLKYEVSTSNSKLVHLNAKGNTITGTALGYGVVDAKVVAKDARGESVTFEFKVQVKDPSKPLSVYPNPVSDYLNIGTLDMAETSIRIISSTGKIVYDETSRVSGMEPARIDMRECAPGTYSLQVVFGGKEYKQTIVKL